MPQKVEHTVHILEGKATLSLRNTSPHWQVRYKVNNKWLRTTTKQEDLTQAKSAAVELVTNAWFRQRNNLPTVSKRFKTIANLAIKRMENELSSDTGKATYHSYILALKNYHIPFFKAHNIDNVDAVALKRFAAWREAAMKRAPSKSTQNTHNAAINRVFDEAVLRNYITPTQRPHVENKGGAASERRPDIRIDEYPALLQAMRAYIQHARAGHERDMRLLLRDYVLILANTGIRQGTEIINLKWRDISLTKSKGREYLTMRIKGKTQKWRSIQVRHRVARYLERIKDRDTKLSKLSLRALLAKGLDKPVIDATHNADLTTAFGRMFSRMMAQADLLIDKHTGKKRTLYSLRHFYATHELTKGNVTAYQLAEHMGTSIGMLQDALAKAIEEQLIDDCVVATSEAQSVSMWRLREGISIAQVKAGKAVKHDIALPISSLATFVKEADQAVTSIFPDLPIINFGHIGDGNLHYNVLLPVDIAPTQYKENTTELNKRVHDLVAQFNGSISAEHGVGTLRRDELRRYKSSVEMDLMISIKRALDPNQIMNPGKLL